VKLVNCTVKALTRRSGPSIGLSSTRRSIGSRELPERKNRDRTHLVEVDLMHPACGQLNTSSTRLRSADVTTATDDEQWTGSVRSAAFNGRQKVTGPPVSDQAAPGMEPSASALCVPLPTIDRTLTSASGHSLLSVWSTSGVSFLFSKTETTSPLLVTC
jgi:hypothetical protein